MDYQRVPEPGDGLRLHLNENTGGCSPKVIEALRAVTPSQVAFYPDYSAAVEACARLLGVEPSWVALTNGLDEGLWAAASACLRAGDAPAEAIISEPAFDMYAACVNAVGGRLVAVEPRDDLEFPLDRILAAISSRTRLVFLCSPNNPTGLAIADAALSAVARALPPGALLFIDEAYADFARGSFLPRLAEFPNVVVGRTFAKAYGLAALRIGCVVGRPEALSLVQRAIPPYSLNVCAITGLLAAIDDRDHYRLVLRPGRGVPRTDLRPLQALGPSLLAERGELRPGARRIEGDGARGGAGRARHLHPRPHGRTGLRGLRPHHGRRGGTHAVMSRRDGGTPVRTAVVARKTAETDIRVQLRIEGRGRAAVSTGIRFLDHMLELVARHGVFNLDIRATGDLDVDQHHTVEDVGIALGEAYSSALGSRRGINRAGYFVMPMDETLAVAALDLGGRAHTVVALGVRAARVGDLQSELVADFFDGFARGLRANVHVKVLYGQSSHHRIEAAFKAFARALRVACSKDRQLGRMLPSTKELL